MSYILNALRKSEQARQSEQTPTLKSSILHPQQQPESKRGLLVALILGNVIVLALFFFIFPATRTRNTSTGSHTFQNGGSVHKQYSRQSAACRQKVPAKTG